jgi:hypothetical protein
MRSDIVQHNATELTVPQVSAVAALAVGSTVTQAALRAGVDRSTLHRWLADDPIFVAALNQAKQEAIDAIRIEVMVGATEAVRVVRDILSSAQVSPALRLRAALALLHSVGVMNPEPIGPTDPKEAAADIKRREFSRTLASIMP